MIASRLKLVVLLAAIGSACAAIGDGPVPLVRVSSIDGMEQVFVPEGSFLMGSRRDDPWANADEVPQLRQRRMR